VKFPFDFCGLRDFFPDRDALRGCDLRLETHSSQVHQTAGPFSRDLPDNGQLTGKTWHFGQPDAKFP
jgi:hypothetical protein